MLEVVGVDRSAAEVGASLFERPDTMPGVLAADFHHHPEVAERSVTRSVERRKFETSFLDNATTEVESFPHLIQGSDSEASLARILV